MYAKQYTRNDLTQGVIPRCDTPLSDTPLPTERPTHDFLLRGPDAKLHPVNVIRDLRAGIESLPKTKGLFKLDRVLTDHTQAARTKLPLLMCGSWEPNSLSRNRSDQAAKLFANPKAPDKRRYADAVTECQCGGYIALFQRAGDRTKPFPSDAVSGHTDDCLKQWRRRAQAHLFEKRAEIFKEMLPLGHGAKDCYGRLGVPEGYTTTTYLTKKIGVDVQELKDTYFEKRKNTTLELLPVFSVTEIADAYNRSRRVIRRHVEEEFGSASVFRDVRKQNREQLDLDYEP
jgi:hypothetical protein